MEYYSAIKKKEILPFAATWMELEGIMLSEISQRRTNTVCSLISGIYKKAKLIELESRTVVGRGWVVGKMGDVG